MIIYEQYMVILINIVKYIVVKYIIKIYIIIILVHNNFTYLILC